MSFINDKSTSTSFHLQESHNNDPNETDNFQSTNLNTVEIQIKYLLNLKEDKYFRQSEIKQNQNSRSKDKLFNTPLQKKPESLKNIEPPKNESLTQKLISLISPLFHQSTKQKKKETFDTEFYPLEKLLYEDWSKTYRDNLKEVLDDEVGRFYFSQFMKKKSGSPELYDFICCVETFCVLEDKTTKLNLALKIYDEFLKPEARNGINLEGDVDEQKALHTIRIEFGEIIKKNQLHDKPIIFPANDIFEKCKKFVLLILGNSFFKSGGNLFCKTDYFHEMLEQKLKRLLEHH